MSESDQSLANRKVWNAVAFQQEMSRKLGLGCSGVAGCGGRRGGRALSKKKKPKPAKMEEEGESDYSEGSDGETTGEKVSLAQKLGLVPLKKKLSKEEWAKLLARANFRGDFTQVCPVCHDEFSVESQVLLSCSHVFHQACIQSFESHVGKKTCPMCRQENYQVRVIHEGKRLVRNRCALRIQTCWRAYRERKKYVAWCKKHPPKDANLRKQYFFNKLRDSSDALLDWMERKSTQDIDVFLASMDESISKSRQMMSLLETTNVQGPLVGHCYGREMRMGGCEEEEEDSLMSWENIYDCALKRQQEDCPICLSSLQEEKKKTVLLSCGHFFHSQCLYFLETHSAHTLRKCPVCRSEYRKKKMRHFSMGKKQPVES